MELNKNRKQISLEKPKTVLLKIFNILFVAVFIYIVYVAIFHNYDAFCKMNPVINIIGASVLFAILYLANRLIKKMDSKKQNIICVVCLLIMLVLQFIFIKYLLVTPSWDYGYVYTSALDFANGTGGVTEYYYIKYPNNIGLMLAFGYLFRIVKLFSSNDLMCMVAALAINVVMINLAIAMTYIFIKRSFGKERATLFCIFSLLVTPFYTYAQFFYTDTITMFFPIAMFYLLYDYYNSDNNKKKYVNLILIGMLGVIGTILKTNIVITFIALIIYILFRSNFKKAIIMILLIALPGAGVMQAYKALVERYVPIEYSEMGFPYTHWIMMGLMGRGAYNSEDVGFTEKIRTSEGKEAAKEANIEVIKERLQSYGFTGYLKFVDHKLSFTWGDGTYYVESKLSRQPRRDNIATKYVIGDKNVYFIYFCQFSHIVLMILILISGLINYKKPFDFIKGMQICIFGVFLFLILWETRSRYLVCFMPVMVYMAFNSIGTVFDSIDSKVIPKIKK